MIYCIIMAQLPRGDRKHRAAFTLSAFGDEISDELEVQLGLLRELGIGYLELRGAWGVNVLHMSDAQVEAVKAACQRHGIRVSCVASPVGKAPITDPLDVELANLERIFQIARTLEAHRVRLFSFYPPAPAGPAQHDAYIPEAVSRLSRMARLAQQSHMLLLLENEKGVVGDTPERCHALLRGVSSQCLRFVWDPANFVQVGVAQATYRGWPLLKPYLAYVQVKDALLADGQVVVAGRGDGQVVELLARLRDSGYRGFLALEPHLVMGGPRGGFSGPEGMRRAVEALRGVMEGLGCREASPGPSWRER